MRNRIQSAMAGLTTCSKQDLQLFLSRAAVGYSSIIKRQNSMRGLFFDMTPESVKELASDFMSSGADKAGGQVGYVSLAASAGKEMFVVRGIQRCPHQHGGDGRHNSFPWPLMPSTFLSAVSQYFFSMREFATARLSEIVECLQTQGGGKTPMVNLFDDVDVCSSVLFLCRYREQVPVMTEAHTDSGILTVLVATTPDDVCGLEVLSRDGRWGCVCDELRRRNMKHEGVQSSAAAVVMAGEMLKPFARGLLAATPSRLLGGEIDAAPHRVRGGSSGFDAQEQQQVVGAVSDRLTMPFQLRLPLEWQGFESQLISKSSAVGGRTLSSASCS